MAHAGHGRRAGGSTGLAGPLRERSEDIPLLVRFLVRRFSVRIGKRIDAVSHETRQRLLHYRWPGNVRELENVLERALILNTGEVLEISPELLPASAPVPAAPAPSAPAPTAPRKIDPSTSMQDVERNHILSVLARTNWVIAGGRPSTTASWPST